MSGVTSVGLIVDDQVMRVTNSPITSDGNIGLSLLPTGVNPGTYTNPSQITVDLVGRILNIIQGQDPAPTSGTVTSVSMLSPLKTLNVQGSPIQTAGTISVDLPLMGNAGVYERPAKIVLDNFGRVSSVVSGGVGSPYYIADYGIATLTAGISNFIPTTAIVPGASLLIQPIVNFAANQGSNLCVQNITLNSNMISNLSQANPSYDAGFCVNVAANSQVTGCYYAVVLNSSVFPPTLYGSTSAPTNVVAAGFANVGAAYSSLKVFCNSLTQTSSIFLSSYGVSSGIGVQSVVTGPGGFFYVCSSNPCDFYYMVIDNANSTPLSGATFLSGGKYPVFSGSLYTSANQWNIPLFGGVFAAQPQPTPPNNFAVFTTLLGGTSTASVSSGYSLTQTPNPYSSLKSPLTQATVSVGGAQPLSLGSNYMSDISYLSLTW